MERPVPIMVVTRFPRVLCLFLIPFLLTAPSPVHAVEKNSKEKPDYMPAIQQELARLDLDVRCNDGTSSCTFTETISKQGPTFDIVIRYSRRTDTVYIYIDKFLSFEPAKGPGLELSHRLLELNRDMVTAKFEWDKPSNSIRLSVVINADSNFDRKAFRSQLIGLRMIAKKLRPELNSYTKP